MKMFLRFYHPSLAGLLFLLTSTLHAETLQELQAKRAQIIGPEIARGTDYTVHSPQAIQTGKTYQCASSDQAKTEAEYNRRYAEIQKSKQAELDAIQVERQALYAKGRAGSISVNDYNRQANNFTARESEVSNKWASEENKLQQAQRDAQVLASGYLSIVVQHAPTDPSASIIPLKDLEPTAAYVEELNNVLRDFLVSCGTRDGMSISHVYRDFFPTGVDVERRQEKPILMHLYTLANGKLTLRGIAGQYNSVATTEINGGARNLTLAGARGNMEEVLKEDSRARGNYREDFAVAANRKAGIVYKLDPYWQQYQQDIGMDSARRIFDGDFVDQKDSTYFKAQVHGFSEIYSAQCKSEIPSFQRFYIPSSRITATRTYLSGRVENDYESTVIPIDIDTRFAPFYLAYEDASRAYFMKSMSVGYEQSGSAANWTEADLAKVIDWAGNFNIWLGFFRQHTCTSATMLQMRDNLLRAANSEKSAQEEGIHYPNAEQESDPPVGQVPSPPASTPTSSNITTQEDKNRAAINAFGGGGLFGGDWKTPQYSKEEFNTQVDLVTGKEREQFNEAANKAEQSLQRLTETTDRANQSRQDNHARLIELIQERNTTPRETQRYTELQSTIEFMMQHLGLTEEPNITAANNSSESKTNTQKIQQESQQTALERRDRERQIDEDMTRKIMELTNSLQQKQIEAAEVFRQRMMAATTAAERTALQQDLKERQRIEIEQLQKQVQTIRTEANNLKKQ